MFSGEIYLNSFFRGYLIQSTNVQTCMGNVGHFQTIFLR